MGKYELQVGPTEIPDFSEDLNDNKIRKLGVVANVEAGRFSQGQMINNNCMVVGTRPGCHMLLVAPMQRWTIPALPGSQIYSLTAPTVAARKPKDTPSFWQGESTLVEVTDTEERRCVVDLFYNETGGLNIQTFEIVSITRVQSKELWQSYSRSREDVAIENWGQASERRIFHGTGNVSPEDLVNEPSNMDSSLGRSRALLSEELLVSDGKIVLLEKQVALAHRMAHVPRSGYKQLVQLRVTRGRVFEGGRNAVASTGVPVEYHSKTRQLPWARGAKDVLVLQNALQIYPEYIVTYRTKRRTLRARRPGQSPIGSEGRAEVTPRNVQASQGVGGSRPSPQPATVAACRAPAGESETISSQDTKMCVVCLSRPVSYILIPCGHPCLCKVCSTSQALARMHRKCPECRQRVASVTRFYGRVVND
jgi:hypothetical protein